MIGARDMAFPRINAFSYWIFLFGGLFLYSSFLIGRPPDGGWFAYVPLTGKTYSPSVAMDFYGLGVCFLGIASTAGAINFIVTVLKMRAPGMTASRLPVFVWSILSMAFMMLFAFPAVSMATALLEADRLFGLSVFDPSRGGSALLYQHLFWFWGHPEVYILFVPATGMVSMIIPTFSRRPIAGYIWIVSALVAISFISFGVWVHHMFATGMPGLALTFFSAAGFVITLPSAVQFFCWIGTMWQGRIRFTTPMLFAIGFLVVFLLGGLSGVMVSVMPFDWQATDTYFVVAHFHYVLNGAVVFPIFGALYYWLPKMTGRVLSERLGHVSFWTMLIGFNVAFFPMHILGLEGMPRRVATYDSGLGWETPNVIATIGAAVFGIGTLLTVANIVWSRRHGAEAGPDPWGADTLEWSTSSPPPDYNFAAIPVVASRHPLWDTTEPFRWGRSGIDDADRALGAEGAADRATPYTAGLDAVPDATMEITSESLLPFVLALGLLLLVIGLLITTWLVIGAAGLIAVVAAVRWAWRTEEDLP
jgi:heme/copper-type cytochrome/quinol oxidase subunit 1